MGTKPQKHPTEPKATIENFTGDIRRKTRRLYYSDQKILTRRSEDAVAAICRWAGHPFIRIFLGRIRNSWKTFIPNQIAGTLFNFVLFHYSSIDRLQFYP